MTTKFQIRFLIWNKLMSSELKVVSKRANGCDMRKVILTSSVVDPSVLTILLVLAAKAVRVLVTLPACMKAQLGVPIGPGVVAFEPSQLGIGALVLAAVQFSLLVRLVWTFVLSVAHKGSIDADFRHTWLVRRAGKQSSVPFIRAPIPRVAGVGVEERLNAVAILVGLPSPVCPRLGIRGRHEVLVIGIRGSPVFEVIFRSQAKASVCIRCRVDADTFIISRNWADNPEKKDHCDLFQEMVGSDAHAKEMEAYKDANGCTTHSSTANVSMRKSIDIWRQKDGLTREWTTNKLAACWTSGDFPSNSEIVGCPH